MNTNAKDLMNAINQIMKTEKKNDKNIYDKILFIFSIAAASKDFSKEENAKSICNVLLDIAKLLKNFNAIKMLSDLFSIVSNEDSEVKMFLMEKCFTDYADIKSIDDIKKLFIQFIKMNNDIGKGLQLFSLMVLQLKAYHTINSDESVFILKAFGGIKELTLEELRLKFFLICSSINICKWDLKKLSEEILKDTNLSNEVELISLIASKEIKKICSFDFDKIKDVYGNKGSEKIESFSKQIALQKAFLDIKEKEVSFDELEKITGQDIENVEEALIDGDINGMFKIKVDYSLNKVIVIYVRKVQYLKEDIAKLSEEIVGIKTKIDFIVKALDTI